MNNFINYLIEVNIALTIFIVLYALLLRNEKNFSLKRKLVVTTLLVAVVAPALKTFSITIFSSSTFIPVLTLPEISISPARLSTSSLSDDKSWWSIVLVVYFVVTAAAALRLAIQVVRLMRYTRRSTAERIGKYRIVEIQGNATFSFFHTIFIGNTQNLSEEDKALIIQHEMVHADKFHSVDRLLIELVRVFCWFNPFLIYYKNELTALHEFESDEEIIQQTDVKKYCNLLARVALMSADFKIANHFNNSLTSKRIAMMKTKRRKISVWKLGFIIPIIACVVVIVACQEQPENHQGTAETTNNDNVIHTKVDNMPEFPGGFLAMSNFLAKNIKYPVDARNNKIEGKVFVDFVVNKDGSVTNAKVLKGPDAELNEEALRVVKLFPKWKPATLNDAIVRSEFVVPIRFALD